MLGKGIYVQPYFAVKGYISAADTEEDIDKTTTAIGDFLRAHRNELS